jgi:hypothetical protein
VGTAIGRISSALVVPPDAPPFVNRAAELEQLAVAWSDVRRGGRRALFFGGEAGVGKTRLAAEFARRAAGEGGVAVAGWCDEELGVPYQPFVVAVRSYLEWHPELGTVERLGRRASALGRLVPELGVGAEMLHSSDPDAERFALFEAVEALVAAATAQAPLIAVLEDLQWAARPTIGLLRYLLRAESVHGLLVVGTYRDTAMAPEHPVAQLLADLRSDDVLDRIAIEGLDATSVRQLVATTGAHDDALADAIHAQTEGNPFFIAEMLRHLAVAPAKRADELGLPESVREVIASRLRRLEPRTVEMLSAAAVIGPTFSLHVLQAVPHISADPDALLDALDEALTQRIVVEVGSGQYSFAHVMIRQALLAGLSATRRARLHGQIAIIIEARAGDDPGRYAAELAAHFVEASDASVVPKVIEYARLAGERAIASVAAEDAVHWFTVALAALSTAPDEATDVRCRVGLGQAQRQSGDPLYRQTLLDAAARARDLGDTEPLVAAALANNRGFVSRTGSVDTEQVEVIEAALAAVGSDDPRARARLLALLALELTFGGDLEQRTSLAEEALAIARRVDDESVLAEVLDRRILAIWVPATLGQRLADTAEAEALAARTGNRVANFWAVYHRTICALESGDAHEMRRCAQRTTELADEIRQPLVHWAATFARGWQALLVGDSETASAAARASFDLGVATGQPDVAVLTALALGVRWSQGRLGEMVPKLKEAVAANPGIPAVESTLALAHAEADDHASARGIVDVAASRDFAIAYDPVWLATMTLWAEVVSQIDHEEAADRLLPMLDPWKDQVAFSGTTVHGAVSHSVASLHAVLGHRDQAAELFGRAEEVHAHLGAPFFQARTHLEHGRLLLEDDRATARAQLDLAIELARAYGYGRIEARAAAALAS